MSGSQAQDPSFLDRFRGKPFRRIQRALYQRVYSYPIRNLLVIGQPKSGSTWLEQMLLDIPGFLRWMPNYIKFEKHDLQPSWLSGPPTGYTVTKTHTRPTDENLRIIHAAARPYVVLLRDLRDIAVSWCFYVGNTPDHPRHSIVAPLDTNARLDYFIDAMLPEFAFWSTTWLTRHDPRLGLIMKYESMLADCPRQLAAILTHYGINLPAHEVARIAQSHAFAARTGRRPGQEDATAFNRKGVRGDWVNHFSPAHKAAFKRTAPAVLQQLGYESSEDW